MYLQCTGSYSAKVSVCPYVYIYICICIHTQCSESCPAGEYIASPCNNLVTSNIQCAKVCMCLRKFCIHACVYDEFNPVVREMNYFAMHYQTLCQALVNILLHTIQRLYHTLCKHCATHSYIIWCYNRSIVLHTCKLCATHVHTHIIWCYNTTTMCHTLENIHRCKYFVCVPWPHNT
jgi:hypothetical protein